MMYHWVVTISLFTTLLLCVFGQNDTDTEVRTIYITSDKSSSQGTSCPVDHCYSLQDVFNNQSYFFDSYTTLELLPGNYLITERVGQLVIANVTNFTFKGSSVVEGTTTITCQSGAAFGFAFISCLDVKISHVKFNNCSAKLNFNSSLFGTVYSRKHNSKKSLGKRVQHQLTSCGVEPEYRMLCYCFLASLNNTKISVHQTSIVHSKGVGILSYINFDLTITNSLLTHNKINCIIFIAGEESTEFSLLESSVMYGQIDLHSGNTRLSSGLNLVLEGRTGQHNINIMNVTLANNKAPFGNFHLYIYCDTSMSIDGVILIDALRSIQIEKNFPGIVLTAEYKAYIMYRYPNYFGSNFGNLFGSLVPANDNFRSNPKHVNVTIKNSDFLGSCVNVRDLSWKTDTNINFNVNNIRISESKCSAAIAIINSDSQYLQFSDLTIISSQYNILSMRNTKGILNFSGTTTILSNQGLIELVNAQILFEGFVLVSGNIAHLYDGVIHLSDSSKVKFHKEVMFANNTGRLGGAIFANSYSSLEFEGNISFIGNSAKDGGAIYLKEHAVINLTGDTKIIFRKNRALTYGGAIYVEDVGFSINKTTFSIICFIHSSNKSGERGNVEFKDNKAGKAGSALFGGWIDICKTSNDIRPHHFLEFKSQNSVASNPTRVCICENSTVNKDKIETQIQVFPGQTFELEVVTVGQRFGIVPATVRAEVRTEVIKRLQKLQDTEDKCTKLTYTVRSSSNNETILLKVEGRDIPQNITVTTELLQFKVSIQVKDCPAGFVFEKKSNICECHSFLLDHGVQCNFDSYTVNRKAQQWIGFKHSTINIIIHPHCPHDYCKLHALSLNLSNPDEQCFFGRSGILCGECGPGLSQVLGTSNCRRCSNSWLSLTVVFCLAGVMLVAGLMLLNLTVSEGTINGLIFYANIVRANTAVFFPGERANSFLSWFIAWLNLDVGVETCFYDGLDAYAKTWLQFVFPFYIWLMVAVIIIGSKYLKKLCSKNAVQVLATLFILSYAKLLRVTITVFQPTRLTNSDIIIWHYDGNVVYFGKTHTPLMVAALLLFVLFFIPYTLILFGIQWFQILSHNKLFGWVNKFKPLFDAYTGPYKDKHRYWTGLLLLVRIGLFSVFSANTSGDPAINLLTIIVVIVCLLTYLALFARGIYNVWLLNILEYFFLLNLIILSASVLYATSVSEPVHIMTQVSVSITLSITALIIIYHSTLIILRLFKAHTNLKITNCLKIKLENDSEKNLKEVDVTALHNKVTHSVVELREPLIS